MNRHWSLWWRQIAAVGRLELKKTFFNKRAWWIYLLALAPVILTGGHSLAMLRRGQWSHDIGRDSAIFAGIYHMAYLRMGIFFGCVVIFSNLFRGEMLAKTMHYYLLAPVRREVLLIGKYLSGLLAALMLFAGSLTLSYILLFVHFGPAFWEFFMRGPGLPHLGWYLLATALACAGYGAIFLLMGLLFRNPMIPAATVMVWEAINPFLPALLKKASVIFYLKSLSPVDAPIQGGWSFLAIDVSPPPAWLAVAGLLLFSALVLSLAGMQVRKLEISYTE